ncbi:hypothetical protein ANCDUO_05300 [Ancylostoma duodenale]|uniref:Uncharacterized protein n=1 Tax=Ancylostoma duodenale TaxID=51022 RepID=A0A0C2DP03_9BILA|nr:hypothetical protein ANCDUO_05300 [Ancylostoma duodenale]
MEMRMLRWMGGITQLGRICNQDIRQLWDVLGKQLRGRAKQRWLDTLHADLKLAKIHPDQVHDRAI